MPDDEGQDDEGQDAPHWSDQERNSIDSGAGEHPVVWRKATCPESRLFNPAGDAAMEFSEHCGVYWHICSLKDFIA